MKTPYDKLYKENENLFGPLYPSWILFTDSLESKINSAEPFSVLDLGCGQGRDSLLLAAKGAKVTSIDHSREGVLQVQEKADKLKLPVKAIHENFFHFKPDHLYDLIILNSVFHFSVGQKAEELRFLTETVQWLTGDGILFLAIHQSPRKEAVVEEWLHQHSSLLLIKKNEDSGLYLEKSTGFESEYSMTLYFIQRTGEQKSDTG